MTTPDGLLWMRDTTAQQADVAVTGADQVLVPHDRRRIALLILAPPVVTGQLSWGGAAAATRGGQIGPTLPPILLQLSDHGALVHGPIRVISSGVGTISYVEVCAPLN